MRKIWLVCIFSFLLIFFTACGASTKTNEDPQDLEAQMGDSVNDFKELRDTDFDDIWEIENENNFFIVMNEWLCKKCDYGEDIENLSHAERVFYIVF